MAYIHAEGYSANSLKHGPFAMLSEESTAILLIDKSNFKTVFDVYEQIKCRTENILIITDCPELNNEISNNNKNIKNSVTIPYNETYKSILFIIVLQYIAYKLAVDNNINPDFPRNLAKVVTV